MIEKRTFSRDERQAYYNSQVLNPTLNVEWNDIYGKPDGLDDFADYSADIEQLKIDVETLKTQMRQISQEQGGGGYGSGIFDIGLCDSYKEGEWKLIYLVKSDLDDNDRLLTQNMYKFTYYDQENGESVYRDILFTVTNDSDTTEGMYKAPCINLYRYLYDGTYQYVINLWLVNNDGTSAIAPNLNGIYSASLANYHEIGSDYPFACEWKWKKVGYEQTVFYYNIETPSEQQIAKLEQLVSQKSENYSYYIRNQRETQDDPYTYALYIWDATNETFVLVQSSVEQETVEEQVVNNQEMNTLYKDLGTYGENDDLDKIVLKDIRTNITSNMFKGDKFEIPNVYSISKRVYNSEYSYRLPDLYVERVNYFAYVKKTVSASNVNPWNDFKITLIKSCPEGLKKSQEIDCSDNNWDAYYNFEGTVTWTELGSGGGGSVVIDESVTVNFTNFDEELIYFPQSTTITDFQLIGISYVDLTRGGVTTRITSLTTGGILISQGDLVQLNIDPTSLDGSAKAFVFTKQV